MATIKEIARKLGISVSSVSKGLSGASDVSEETRQLILNTAIEMGYVSRKSKTETGTRKVCVFVENMGMSGSSNSVMKLSSDFVLQPQRSNGTSILSPSLWTAILTTTMKTI